MVKGKAHHVRQRKGGEAYSIVVEMNWVPRNGMEWESVVAPLQSKLNFRVPVQFLFSSWFCRVFCGMFAEFAFESLSFFSKKEALQEEEFRRRRSSRALNLPLGAPESLRG